MSSVTNAPPTEQVAMKNPRESSSLSTWRMFLLAVATAIIVFLIGLGLDMLILHEHETRRLAFEVSDVLGGLVAGVLSFRLLQYERDRRARLRQKIAIIADMNHHVRNALQVISFHAYSSADKEQIEAVRESMERIQWALKEVLPKL
jgi:signal transduction histidine kinase